MARASRMFASAGEYVEHMQGVLRALDCAAIDRVAALVFAAWRDDRQVFVLGNGGSAATASHYVTDFVKTASVEGERRLRAHSLVDNFPLSTAIGNDLDFEQIFEYPLAAWSRRGDVLIAISGSGTSPNVVRACRFAKQHGLVLVALTGFEGGTIAAMADVHVNVPSDNYGPIEDLHMSIGHIVTQSLQARVRAQAAKR